MSNELSLVSEAVAHFLSATVVAVSPCSGGVNNVVNYVDVTDGQGSNRLVLRIYNNGNNEDKVLFEHFVLANIDTQSLDFQLPVPLKSRYNGSTYVQLKSGTHCALFPLIPGALPKLRCVRAIGKASGQISRALSNVLVPEGMKIPTPPYHDLYAAHSAVGSSVVFLEFVAKPEFDTVRDTMEFICDRIKSMETRIQTLIQKGFPQQLIHGDLHYDNVLCDLTLGRVTGLLDFEFCAMDWRAMELAICLSKYAGEPDPFPYFADFVSGFAEGDGARLDNVEVENLPQLVVLRILSNVVFFVGRAIAGEDTIETLTVRVKTYAKRVLWLEENESRIVSLVHEEQERVKHNSILLK